MLTIPSLKPIPNQTLTVILETKETISFNLRFLPTQNTWQGSIQYQTFPVMRFNIVVTINLLRQYVNLIPFGLMCFSNDGVDPFQITDFTSQNGLPARVSLYILNPNDIAIFNKAIYGQ
jgi:hypothetical protein